MSEDYDGGVLVHLQHLNEKHTYRHVQILGMLFANFKQMVEKNLETLVSICVIGIPSYFIDLQRRAYLDVAHIAACFPQSDLKSSPQQPQNTKSNGSHYFFALRVPSDTKSGNDSDFEYKSLLNYGLTISSKGLEKELEEFDRVLEDYSAFSVKEVKRSVSTTVAVDNGGFVEAKAAANSTTLAPNVEDYSGSVARMIDAGSDQLIKGILWCGDVMVDRLKWGNEF
ncbi:unnamed protein product [Lactuca saligna]|uniref:Uncharacterized protein n=1 Tax=Lactuca saligna TaxID=75948 RepID=A0AA35Z2D2_LACSI|nr:unnamed protein product [Lactuca saligna]